MVKKKTNEINKTLDDFSNTLEEPKGKKSQREIIKSKLVEAVKKGDINQVNKYKSQLGIKNG